MSWPEYQSKYRQFLISIHQAQLTTIAAGAALASFPQNLPDNIKQGLSDAMRTVAELLDKAANQSRNPKSRRSRRFSAKFTGDPGPAFSPMLNMYALVVKEGQSPDSVDYQSALFRQQLVMVIAHAEAFLGDSIRAICLAQPRVIESEQRQIPWSVALAFPDRASLVAGLVDQFVGYLMQAKDVTSLLALLKKTMGLDVPVSSEHTRTLSVAEQVRHILVHNGGRVDRRFIEKTGIGVPIGQLYPVDEKFIASATCSLLVTAQAMFAAVSKKYYSIDDSLSRAGWETQDPSSQPKRHTKRSRTKRVEA